MRTATGPRARHRTKVAIFLALGLTMAACGRDPTDAAGGGDRVPAIASVTLVAGGEGLVAGSNLDLLPSSLSVDGHPVAPSTRSATELRFQMPSPRACEVDGRPISLVLGALTRTDPLSVATTLQMQPGESRILTWDELAHACLQVPAAPQSFVLSVLNPAVDPGDAPDPLFVVHAWTAAGGEPSSDRGGFRRSLVPWHAEGVREVRSLSAGDDAYADDPVPFDPRYSTAMPGDTVPWVDFRSPAWYNDASICRATRARVPTFGAIVAAVSTSGRTVIAYDQRSPHSQEWTSGASRARLTRLADIVERWTIPAVRESFDPAYQPVRGAGGRWWHIFRTGVSAPTVDQAALPRTMCPHYSEVAATLAPDVPLTRDDQVEVMAGYLIHEYAHHAEDVIAVRRSGSVFGRGPASWSGIGESWAQTVQETAARLASGQTTAARYDALTPGSGVPYADFYLTGYGERPDLSPWGGGRGPYDQGTRLVMFLREQWGDASLGSSRERFYGRVWSLPTYDFASMAALAGLSPTEALDAWSLAEATDDLVDPSAAARFGLPQIRTWVPQDRVPVPQVPRSSDSRRAVAVAHGSYAALYVLSPSTGEAKGVSLTFSDFGTAPFIARITRLR